MYKMLLCGVNLRDLFDAADFLANLSGLTFQSTSFFLKEEKASSVSASCTLNCLSCEDRPLLTEGSRSSHTTVLAN